MIEKQELSLGTCQFQSAHSCVINAGVSKRCQVQTQVVGEQRPNDVAMGDEGISGFWGGEQRLFDGCHGTLLHFTERFAAQRSGRVRPSQSAPPPPIARPVK